MDRPAIEQLKELSRSLPPFQQGAALSPQLQAFCAYYHIDFGERMAGVSHSCGVVESGKFRLATHCWQVAGARANLLLVHGYFDHTGLYNKLIAWALESGFNVLIFDLPGHGLSSGEPAVIDDFGDYLRLPNLQLVAFAAHGFN